MIHLQDKDMLLLHGHNSRGNQLKFKKDEYWYKLDDTGYKGFSEAVVSCILRHSNIESYVQYEEESFEFYGEEYFGCKSKNFLPNGSELVTAGKLFQAYTGQSPTEVCKRNTVKESIDTFVSLSSQFTGMSYEEIGKYITTLLELDALTLNEDRHFNNIAFVYKDGLWAPAPIFDNGDSFLSDTFYYPLSMDDEQIYETEKIKSKPFSASFLEQKEIAEEMFGHQFGLYTDNIEEIFPEETYYSQQIFSRVFSILEHQLELYPDLYLGSLERKIEKGREESAEKVSRNIRKEKEKDIEK